MRLLATIASRVAVASLMGATARCDGSRMSAPAPERGVAIVTGGSRGIGAACARGLAARGYGV
eukprot:2500101-Prymnesium_polylepis.1